MLIRAENRTDLDEIYDLVKVAFETAEVSSGREQDFVNTLRSGDGYINDLALVAEEKGILIGHIMLTRIMVVNGTEAFEGLYLAPISVKLDHRGQGTGSALILESFRIAREMGFRAVFLVGDPKYYERFGFRQLDSFGIAYSPEEIPAVNVMALELTSEALSGVSGKIDFD